MSKPPNPFQPPTHSVALVAHRGWRGAIATVVPWLVGALIARGLAEFLLLLTAHVPPVLTLPPGQEHAYSPPRTPLVRAAIAVPFFAATWATLVFVRSTPKSPLPLRAAGYMLLFAVFGETLVLTSHVVFLLDDGDFFQQVKHLSPVFGTALLALLHQRCGNRRTTVLALALTAWFALEAIDEFQHGFGLNSMLSGLQVPVMVVARLTVLALLWGLRPVAGSGDPRAT